MTTIQPYQGERQPRFKFFPKVMSTTFGNPQLYPSLKELADELNETRDVRQFCSIARYFNRINRHANAIMRAQMPLAIKLNLLENFFLVEQSRLIEAIERRNKIESILQTLQRDKAMRKFVSSLFDHTPVPYPRWTSQNISQIADYVVAKRKHLYGQLQAEHQANCADFRQEVQQKRQARELQPA